MMLCFFFFSSRRRHTRLQGDWSSDVCSSDLRNRDDYRQIFSAVFSDYFLFDSLIGLSNPRLDAQAHDYLQQLHLDHKVKIKDGVLSTTALSQGPRKRLAPLTAYLEDRSFYLFYRCAS